MSNFNLNNLCNSKQCATHAEIQENIKCDMTKVLSLAFVLTDKYIIHYAYFSYIEQTITCHLLYRLICMFVLYGVYMRYFGWHIKRLAFPSVYGSI